MCCEFYVYKQAAANSLHRVPSIPFPPESVVMLVSKVVSKEPPWDLRWPDLARVVR